MTNDPTKYTDVGVSCSNCGNTDYSGKGLIWRPLKSPNGHVEQLIYCQGCKKYSRPGTIKV